MDKSLCSFENLSDDMKEVVTILGIEDDLVKIEILLNCIESKCKEAMTAVITLISEEFDL